MALSGHPIVTDQCLLLGGKADMPIALQNVRFWHKADIPLCIEYAVSSPEPVSSA
jgi:hypothetical protein